VEVLPYLEKGGHVRVLAGPLKGLEGSVLRSKSSTRIVINVDMIRQSVAVEVDAAFLGPA
jgi:transcription antitermination factor NusG